MSTLDMQLLEFWRTQLVRHLDLLAHTERMVQQAGSQEDLAVLTGAEHSFNEIAGRALAHMGGLGAAW